MSMNFLFTAERRVKQFNPNTNGQIRICVSTLLVKTAIFRTSFVVFQMLLRVLFFIVTGCSTHIYLVDLALVLLMLQSCMNVN